MQVRQTDTGSCNLMQRETVRATHSFGEEGTVNVTSSQPFADCPLFFTLYLPHFGFSARLGSIWQYLAFVQIKVKVYFWDRIQIKAHQCSHWKRAHRLSGAENKRTHNEYNYQLCTEEHSCPRWRSQTKNVTCHAFCEQMNPRLDCICYSKKSIISPQRSCGK